MSCQCRFCRRFDRLHEQEAEAARRSREAQRYGDFDSAKLMDRLRTRWLEAAGRCLEQCEGEA